MSFVADVSCTRCIHLFCAKAVSDTINVLQKLGCCHCCGTIVFDQGLDRLERLES